MRKEEKKLFPYYCHFPSIQQCKKLNSLFLSSKNAIALSNNHHGKTMNKPQQQQHNQQQQQQQQQQRHDNKQEEEEDEELDDQQARQACKEIQINKSELIKKLRKNNKNNLNTTNHEEGAVAGNRRKSRHTNAGITRTKTLTKAITSVCFDLTDNGTFNGMHYKLKTYLNTRLDYFIKLKLGCIEKISPSGSPLATKTSRELFTKRSTITEENATTLTIISTNDLIKQISEACLEYVRHFIGGKSIKIVCHVILLDLSFVKGTDMHVASQCWWQDKKRDNHLTLKYEIQKKYFIITIYGLHF